MVITHHGGQCFKVSFGGTTLAFDPISKKSKLPPVKFGSDIALVSLNHPNFNGTDQVSHGSKEPFVIFGPGEYELGQVTVRGYGVKTIYDKEDHFNTIYQVGLEDMNLLFLGALNTSEIDSNILKEIGDVDVLFLPIGGDSVLDVPEAYKLAVKLEARVIIPMHYEKESLKAFLKESGNEKLELVDKLTLKRRDLSEMSGEVVVLKS